MSRISNRLEKKDKLNLYDYYTLGKLIHYIADAFTYPHNASFPTGLYDHRAYEVVLQKYFLQYIAEDPQVNAKSARSVMEAIYICHREYEDQESSIYTDSRFALTACCCALAVLMVKPI